jgi:hypothetical protein
MNQRRVVKGKANKWGREAGMTDVSQAPFANPYHWKSTSPTLRRDLYRDWITKNDSHAAQRAREKLPRLRGRNLACTCPLDQPCHADVLLELANAPGDRGSADNG